MTVTGNLIELNETNFGPEVLNSERPVLVQFWADWWAPCRAMTPVLKSVAEDRFVGVKVARVNVEQNEGLVEEYGVRAVPTRLIFNRGGLRDQIVRRATEWDVRQKLDRFA